VVERAVLHHQHDERVDRQVARRGQVRAALGAGGLGHDRVGRERRRERGGEAAGDRRALEELASS
jgi:hypothetical protein